MTGRTTSHYQVLDKLGEGGMGVVYKARDTRLGRLVALKFLPPERMADPDRKRRFMREARAASALNHPNILTIYDIAEEGGGDFIAMEYVSGRTLSQLTEGKPLAVKEALGYAVQIADALIAAHRAGIIHRDLKPGNVMVTDDGRAKVLDFGLAKLAELGLAGAESTLTLVAGTPADMAPEQAEGHPVDLRSDIYSFGAVLYEMLAGRRAFAGFGREEPPPLSAVSPGLQQLVARCLRRDPAERYQSAAELKTALEEASREPQAAPSLPAAERERFEDYRSHYADIYQPTGAEDSRWVAELALANFRRDRVRMMEAGFFAERIAQLRKTENLPGKLTFEQEARLHARILMEDAEGGRSVLNRLHKWERAFARDIEKITAELVKILEVRALRRAMENRAKTKPIPAQAPSNEELAETLPDAPAPAGPIARGGPCPCGSGKKYKRCCGHDAPGIINRL